MYTTTIVITLLYFITIVPDSKTASYENCRMIPGHSLIYHRRIKQEPTNHVSLQFISFPEQHLDRHGPYNRKVISCILCKDQKRTSESTNSGCRIIQGGIGHTFVKFALTSGPTKGYDYDIKIYGKTLK